MTQDNATTSTSTAVEQPAASCKETSDRLSV